MDGTPPRKIALFVEELRRQGDSTFVRQIQILQEFSSKSVSMKVTLANPEKITIDTKMDEKKKYTSVFEEEKTAWFYVVRRFFGLSVDCDIQIFDFSNTVNPYPAKFPDWRALHIPSMIKIRDGNYEYVPKEVASHKPGDLASKNPAFGRSLAEATGRSAFCIALCEFRAIGMIGFSISQTDRMGNGKFGDTIPIAKIHFEKNQHGQTHFQIHHAIGLSLRPTQIGMIDVLMELIGKQSNLQFDDPIVYVEMISHPYYEFRSADIETVYSIAEQLQKQLTEFAITRANPQPAESSVAPEPKPEPPKKKWTQNFSHITRREGNQIIVEYRMEIDDADGILCWDTKHLIQIRIPLKPNISLDLSRVEVYSSYHGVYRIFDLNADLDPHFELFIAKKLLHIVKMYKDYVGIIHWFDKNTLSDEGNLALGVMWNDYASQIKENIFSILVKRYEAPLESFHIISKVWKPPVLKDHPAPVVVQFSTIKPKDVEISTEIRFKSQNNPIEGMEALFVMTKMTESPNSKKVCRTMRLDLPGGIFAHSTAGDDSACIVDFGALNTISFNPDQTMSAENPVHSFSLKNGFSSELVSKMASMMDHHIYGDFDKMVGSFKWKDDPSNDKIIQSKLPVLFSRWIKLRDNIHLVFMQEYWQPRFLGPVPILEDKEPEPSEIVAESSNSSAEKKPAVTKISTRLHWVDQSTLSPYIRCDIMIEVQDSRTESPRYLILYTAIPVEQIENGDHYRIGKEARFHYFSAGESMVKSFTFALSGYGYSTKLVELIHTLIDDMIYGEFAVTDPCKYVWIDDTTNYPTLDAKCTQFTTTVWGTLRDAIRKEFPVFNEKASSILDPIKMETLISIWNGNYPISVWNDEYPGISLHCTFILRYQLKGKSENLHTHFNIIIPEDEKRGVRIVGFPKQQPNERLLFPWEEQWFTGISPKLIEIIAQTLESDEIEFAPVLWINDETKNEGIRKDHPALFQTWRTILSSVEHSTLKYFGPNPVQKSVKIIESKPIPPVESIKIETQISLWDINTPLVDLFCNFIIKYQRKEQNEPSTANFAIIIPLDETRDAQILTFPQQKPCERLNFKREGQRFTGLASSLTELIALILERPDTQFVPVVWINDQTRYEAIEKSHASLFVAWRIILSSVEHSTLKYFGPNPVQKSVKIIESKPAPIVEPINILTSVGIWNRGKPDMGVHCSFTIVYQNASINGMRTSCPFHLMISQNPRFDAVLNTWQSAANKQETRTFEFKWVAGYYDGLVDKLSTLMINFIRSDVVRSALIVWNNDESNHDAINELCPGIMPIWRNIRASIQDMIMNQSFESKPQLAVATVETKPESSVVAIVPLKEQSMPIVEIRLEVDFQSYLSPSAGMKGTFWIVFSDAFAVKRSHPLSIFIPTGTNNIGSIQTFTWEKKELGTKHSFFLTDGYSDSLALTVRELIVLTIDKEIYPHIKNLNIQWWNNQTNEHMINAKCPGIIRKWWRISSAVLGKLINSEGHRWEFSNKLPLKED